LLGFLILEAFLACRLPIMGLLKAALFASIVLGVTGTPLDGELMLMAGSIAMKQQD
jgi:hypothetical protein